MIELFDVHHAARLRHAIFVEGFDGEVVVLAQGQGAEFQGLAGVDPNLVGLVEFIAADAPQNVVTHGARHGFPADGRIARIRVAFHAQVGGGGRWGAAAVAENADVRKGQVEGGHMHVFKADVARFDRCRQFVVEVRAVLPDFRKISQQLPALALPGVEHLELQVDRAVIAENVRLVVRIIYLKGLDVVFAEQVDGGPLSGGIGARYPERAYIFIGEVRRFELVTFRRGRAGLLIGQQYPAGKQFILARPLRRLFLSRSSS